MSFVCNLPVGAIFLLPVLARLIHFLLDAAFFQKVALLPLYEPTEKDVALMDKCDGNIGDGLVRTLLNLFAEDSRVKMSLAESTSLYASWVIIRPLLKPSHTQIVFVVKQ